MDQEVLIRRAKSFSLMKAELAAASRVTSSRDYRLTLRTPEHRAWQPGQFVMLRWGAHLVGRPFAIVDWQKEGSGGLLEVWIRRLGAGTEELFTQAREGQSLWLTAPLGQGLAPATGRTLFLSGGVGAASILPLARASQKRFWIHGERSSETLDVELVADRQKARPDCLYFEESSAKAAALRLPHAAGRVTEALTLIEEEHARTPFAAVVSCGPSAMLDAVERALKKSALKKVKHWLGLEEKMGCGVGLCFSCSVSTNDGMERCCLEGPWFASDRLNGHFEFRKTGRLT